MNQFLAQEIYIRLAEDNSAFVCTIRRGKFRIKMVEFRLAEQIIPEDLSNLVEKRPSRSDRE